MTKKAPLMFKLFLRWFNRNFSDPQAVVLIMILLFGFTFIVMLGQIFAPILIAIVIAYLLEGVIHLLEVRGIKRLPAAIGVYVSALTIFVTFVVGVIPSLWNQLSTLIQDLPNKVTYWKTYLLKLQVEYPQYISEDQVKHLSNVLTDKIGEYSQLVVSSSVESLVSIVAILIYLVLVPLLIYFFLADKAKILSWLLRWLPSERRLANKVWLEVNDQLANYVRGKVLEIIIVGASSTIVFTLMGLNYALLLGVLVGLSVIIPYVGAAVVTLPVLFVAYTQWGLTAQFGYVALAYGIIQALDGNVLVPILFSEAVNLHPVAIISAVLFFGGVWGFWGVFFAIPLATLVNAVIGAWDEVREAQEVQGS
jgi:putative permease